MKKASTASEKLALHHTIVMPNVEYQARDSSTTPAYLGYAMICDKAA
jgi:hypothetical protein